MIDGLWLIRFASSVDLGGGLIAVRDGLVAGGDYGFTYVGKIQHNETSNKVIGTVHIQKYSPQGKSILPGIDDYHLNIDGDFRDGRLQLKGQVRGQEALVVNITGEKLREFE